MAISYEWEITEILTDTVDDTQGVIVEVSWKRIGTDGDITSHVNGKSTLQPGESFILLENVTQENVISWIELSMDEVEHSLLEEQIQISIQKIKEAREVVEDTRVVTSFPWANEPEE